jgi:hypothetical protein
MRAKTKNYNGLGREGGREGGRGRTRRAALERRDDDVVPQSVRTTLSYAMRSIASYAQRDGYYAVLDAACARAATKPEWNGIAVAPCQLERLCVRARVWACVHMRARSLLRMCGYAWECVQAFVRMRAGMRGGEASDAEAAEFGVDERRHRLSARLKLRATCTAAGSPATIARAVSHRSWQRVRGTSHHSPQPPQPSQPRTPTHE